ncbi:MAG: hypothetical protein ACLP7J_12865 [Streptosporangiaceae bacterium]
MPGYGRAAGTGPGGGLPAAADSGPATVISGDERAGYLAQVCRVLWPPPARVSAYGRAGGRPGTSGGAEFIVLPNARRPRLIVPPGRRAAAAAVRRYGEPGSARAQLATRALALMLASGAGRVMLRDRLRIEVPSGAPAIDAYLRAQLDADLAVSMHLGAARANRKPVLQLVTPRGQTAGFAKVGTTPLAGELVAAERDALLRLRQASLSELCVPAVLHAGTWRELPVLVLSPLPVWQRRVPLPPGRLARAMAEVAAVTGLEQAGLAGSAYWYRLGQRLAGADDTADAAELAASLRELGRRAGQATLTFGAWHGDWTPWNMASTPGGLLVWDWERFTAGVPLGFDALHCWLQSQVVSGQREPRAAAAELASRAAHLLEPFGVTADSARLTALLYLADLAVRYLADRQEAAGARLGAPGQWLIPAVAAGAGQL